MTSTHAGSNFDGRYHYLDALRATCMLLGIVLHAAWIMMPIILRTPLQDADASLGAGWLFTLIHMFRMQVFFLLAGFFASLVYTRGGTSRFIVHRATRVGIPLLCGWAVLFPWCTYYYAWGAKLSGRTLGGQELIPAWLGEMHKSFQGDLGLLHLWFLYDLLWIYAGTVVLKTILDRAVDRRRHWRNRLDDGLTACVRSPANILLLAVPSTLLLVWGRYWIGIEGYPNKYLPEWSGLLHYGLFFLVGWITYSRRELLTAFHQRWRLNLAVGVAISFAIWGFQWHFSYWHVTFAYPAMTVADIHDYPAIREELLEAGHKGSRHPAHEVWSGLSAEWKTFLRDSPTATLDQLIGLADEVTATYILAPPGRGTENGDDGEMALAGESLAALLLERRKELESLFPGAIPTRITDRTDVRLLKVAYSFVYALGMWALVFGMIGWFHRWMSVPSPAIRYLADSSYWLYLVHIPILFQLAIWIGKFPLTPAGKFAFYNLALVAVLLPSYHYLVRSSIIGKVLNGRAHPFVPFFQSPLFASPTDICEPPDYPAQEEASEQTPESPIRTVALPTR